ncbi:MAG: anthranilate/aminodeoxychorismate synthase component II [Deltaproteobacteria bacterium RBG_16_48_10]|nr:MAG: anthranilate/aminodeoxychorismate synthase component II [Deltaproteobacteria bacterium RBG_16_48_10]
MILMIDNYDSFTYNLVQYIAGLGEEVVVERNDALSLEDIRRLKPTTIFLSPGPCSPKEAGITVEVIRHFYRTVPIMGVCLGHQAIGYAFGGAVVRAKRIMHGKTSPIFHDGQTIYRNLPNPFEATRYHSLIVDRKTLPECLEISAWTEEGEIMGVRHMDYQLEGVQFHPESILTPSGCLIIKNFVRSIST